MRIADLSLVVLIGDTPRSEFADAHFGRDERVPVDACRDVLPARLDEGVSCVVAIGAEAAAERRAMAALAHRHHVHPVAIVLGQAVPSPRQLEREGFAQVFTLPTREAVAAARVARVPLPTDRRCDRGPFDIVGDVHGCAGELSALLDRLGYEPDARCGRRHPAGRTAVFLGDLIDRGPDGIGVLRLVMRMAAGGAALCVLGNHEAALARKLRGVRSRPNDLLGVAATFLAGLEPHYVLDEGRLVVAHAGLPASMHGRSSSATQRFALFGESGGVPAHAPRWVDEYRGAARVVYGHRRVVAPKWVNRTLGLDTGCVFGAALSALRYPEDEIVSVPASKAWCVVA